MIHNLDEAISHAREVAKERNETANLTPTEYGDYINSCRECAAEHEQLAEWLTELQKRREADKWNVIHTEADLPKEYGNYLVVVGEASDREIDIGTYHPRNFSKSLKLVWSLCDANGFYWADDKGVKVIAWKPLPKPYESEGK